MKSFKSFHAVSKVKLNLKTLKDIGRVCSKVVLFFNKSCIYCEMHN